MDVYEYNFSLEYEIFEEIDGFDYSSRDFKEFWTNTNFDGYEVLSKSISLISDRKIVIDKKIRMKEDFTEKINDQLKLFQSCYSSEWKGFYEVKKIDSSDFSKRFEPPFFG
jgi:hypothetical protein